MQLLLSPWVATCRETADRLSEMLDGELRPREERRVRRHLDRCPFCRDVLRSLVRTVGHVRSLRADSDAAAAPSAAPAVVARIRSELHPRGG